MCKSSAQPCKTGLVAAIIAVLSFPAGAADASRVVGTWVNQDRGTKGIARVVVTQSGPLRLKVRILGRCRRKHCDWGTVTGHMYFERFGYYRIKVVTARFMVGNVGKTVILRSVGDTRLDYEVLADFAGGQTDYDYYMAGQLYRATTLPE